MSATDVPAAVSSFNGDEGAIKYRDPYSFAQDSEGNVYFAHYGGVSKLTSTGVFVEQIIYKLGTIFNGVAINSLDQLYVTATDRHVYKYSTTGTLLATYGDGLFASGDGQFKTTSGIAIDSSDNYYVADSSNNRIQNLPLQEHLLQSGELKEQETDNLIILQV